MQHTFVQKLIMTVVAGFGAACLFWMFRHIVDEAFWESNEGWRESLKGSTKEHHHK